MSWSCGHGTFVVCACKNTYYGMYGSYFIYLVSYCSVLEYSLLICDLVMNCILIGYHRFLSQAHTCVGTPQSFAKIYE
jgi:hypothetical protein